MLSSARRVRCLLTAGYMAAPGCSASRAAAGGHVGRTGGMGGTSGRRDRATGREAAPTHARAEHPNTRQQPLSAAAQAQATAAPASARNTACTAGRRWKGRVTAARSAPSSTLQQQSGGAHGRGGDLAGWNGIPATYTHMHAHTNTTRAHTHTSAAASRGSRAPPLPSAAPQTAPAPGRMRRGSRGRRQPGPAGTLQASKGVKDRRHRHSLWHALDRG